ncbi:MAG: hypothetical protein AAF799_47960 [Myxococcota bacterium]
MFALPSLLAVVTLAAPPEATIDRQTPAWQLPKLEFSRPTTLWILTPRRFGTWRIIGSSFGGNGCRGATMGLDCGPLQGIQLGTSYQPQRVPFQLFSLAGWSRPNQYDRTQVDLAPTSTSAPKSDYNVTFGLRLDEGALNLRRRVSNLRRR